MSTGPSIVGFLPPGPDRDALAEALAPIPVDLLDEAHAGLGAQARVVLARRSSLAALREVLSPAIPVIVLLEPHDDPDAALGAGASDVCPWPGSAALLRRRVAPFVGGDLGPGWVVLDAPRTTSLVHAVRNPLNVITLYAELLKMEPLGPEGLASVTRLVRAAKRVDALVGELETLLYVQAGKAPLRFQPFDLGELTDAVVAEHQPDIDDKPLVMDVTASETGTLALGDPDLTRRALHAVFGRVIKLCLGHAAVGVRTFGPTPTVEIEAPIPPIPSDRVAAFHAPATELDVRESLGGVGVGLSFAHAVLTAMEGRLEHATTAEGLAIVRLVLPEARL